MLWVWRTESENFLAQYHTCFSIYWTQPFNFLKCRTRSSLLTELKKLQLKLILIGAEMLKTIKDTFISFNRVIWFWDHAIVGYHIFYLWKSNTKDNLIWFIFIVQTCTVDSGFLGHFDVRQTILTSRSPLPVCLHFLGWLNQVGWWKGMKSRSSFHSHLKRKKITTTIEEISESPNIWHVAKIIKKYTTSREIQIHYVKAPILENLTICHWFDWKVQTDGQWFNRLTVS